MKTISTISKLPCPLFTCAGYITVKFIEAEDHSIRVEGKCDHCNHEIDVEACCQAVQEDTAVA